MSDQLRADVPKTDRELLLQIHADVKNLKDTITGPSGDGGICKDVKQLQRDRWYLAGGIALLLVMVGAGRLIEVLYVTPSK